MICFLISAMVNIASMGGDSKTAQELRPFSFGATFPSGLKVVYQE
jgi:hypothetical protein